MRIRDPIHGTVPVCDEEKAVIDHRFYQRLRHILEQNGFAVQRGVGGLPTGWVARWGSGRPVIALGSDIDAIPQASQKPGVAFRAPLIEGAPGHGEGHNSGVPLNITAALAVKALRLKLGVQRQ